jgi:TonB family protein
MKKNNPIPALFSPSGCLTPEAMGSLAEGTLTGGHLEAAQQHLQSCELCRDALEGLSVIHDQERLSAAVAELDTRIRNKFSGNNQDVKKPARHLNRIWTAVSVAASILLLIGLYFLFNDSAKEKQSTLTAQQDTSQQFAALNPVTSKQDTHKGGLKEGSLERLDAYREIAPPEARGIGGVPVSEDKTETVMEPDVPEPEIVMVQEDQVPEEETLEMVLPENRGLEDPVPPGASATALLKQSGKEERKRQAETVAEESDVFLSVEQSPGFPGGPDSLEQYIRNNLHYPPLALGDSIEGTVYLNFVLEKDGSVTNARILRGLGSEFDSEALRLVLSMPKWTPGYQSGTPVRVSYNLPVFFKLP